MELCLLLHGERNDAAPLFGADDFLLDLSIFLTMVRHIELTDGGSIALDLPLDRRRTLRSFQRQLLTE